MRGRHLRHGSAADSILTSTSQSEDLPGLLRRSLRRVLAAGCYEDSDETELRIALRDVCERARRDGVRAEHLLVVLKECWRELPERADYLPRFDADEALAHVVSACINEYYQDRKVREWGSPSRCPQEVERINAFPHSGEIQ